MVQTTGAALHRQVAEQEGFTPGPRLLMHVLAHLWSRTSAWARLMGLAALAGLIAKATGMA